jgi:diketogulonate reductase-like aldo/keto reductase
MRATGAASRRRARARLVTLRAAQVFGLRVGSRERCAQAHRAAGSDPMTISRRRVLSAIAAASAATRWGRAAGAPADPLTRAIPSTGELLPVIGMGSYRTFDVRLDDALRERLGQVLASFFDAGGALVDSSPMYGEAESVLGELLAAAPGRDRLFAATKVWTNGKRAGEEQMRRSMQRMRVSRFDLMQIHNLRDWKVHLPTLLQWKERGLVRYIGVTTSHGRYHEDLAGLLQKHRFDFVQLSYSLANRAADARLLPIAAQRGIAVIVNRPFQQGTLFTRVRGLELPAWAAQFGIHSWGQFFLKYAVSHPAVTCAIPATSRPRHMRDNMGACRGALPDAASRRRMEAFIDAL